MLKRRPASMERDYPQLLAMQHLSFRLNFPHRSFQESWFRSTLAFSMRRGDVWVYVLGNETVGWLWLDWSLPDAVHVSHIQVAETHWGQGIGRRIMEDVVRDARKQGRTAVTLNVTKSNQRAIRLYTRMGFKVEEDRDRRQFMRLCLKEPPDGEQVA